MKVQLKIYVQHKWKFTKNTTWKFKILYKNIDLQNGYLHQDHTPKQSLRKFLKWALTHQASYLRQRQTRPTRNTKQSNHPSSLYRYLECGGECSAAVQCRATEGCSRTSEVRRPSLQIARTVGRRPPRGCLGERRVARSIRGVSGIRMFVSILRLDKELDTRPKTGHLFT